MAHECYLPEINLNSQVKQSLCSDMDDFLIKVKSV